MWVPRLAFGTMVLALIIDSFASARNRPHIIFVVADDLGWNDVGWHNRLIHTPNLEQLALEGVILNQSYVQSVCTPSRTSFMTGYYPYHVGRQNHILHPLVPTGVPLRFPFLPERLREAGYSTHMVGKWHLGYCNWSYTPTYRGFDSFFGFYNGALDYFSHTRSAVERGAAAKWNLPEVDIGFDLRNNTLPSKRYNGVYSTTLFARAAIDILSSSSPDDPLFLYLSFQAVHSPLQVPKVFEDLYSHVVDEKRRKYSGMVTAMDDAVGDVVEALKKFHFWDNTIFIFTTDNGGQTAAGGNNWPLRGNKGTLWEGGTRAVTFVHGSRLRKTGYVNNRLFHAVDWFPTILHLAGAKPVAGLDGINQWRTISSDVSRVREEFVYNIYDSEAPRGAIRVRDYKLIRGFPGNPSGWMAPTTDLHFEQENVYCHVKKNRTLRRNAQEFRLYNLAEDPMEKHNLADAMPDLLTELVNSLQQKTAAMVPADDPSINTLGDPLHWGGVFTPGWCIAK